MKYFVLETIPISVKYLFLCTLLLGILAEGSPHHHTQSSFTRCLSVPHRSQQIKTNWRHLWCIASLSATDKIVIICVQTDFVTCRKSRLHWYTSAPNLSLILFTLSVTMHLHWHCCLLSPVPRPSWIPSCVSSMMTEFVRQWTLEDEFTTVWYPSNFLS